ncbi:hypothetical protein [Bradyrhizobium sp. USDA 4452]
MMPLHRDIHWLGRQWAVTGHGLQLINQKQMGYYDIEAARLWEARVTEIQSKVWIDRPDFDKALEIARGKFAYLAPADLPPPAAVAPPPAPPVRAVLRAPLGAESVPSIEELLARLKSKSVAAAPVAKPAEEAPARPPLKPEPPKLETPKPEPPKVESPRAEPAERGAPKPEPPNTEPIRSEAPRSEAPKPDACQVAPVKPEAPTPPVLTTVRQSARPAWPVFDRKIAGSGRFVHPWRVPSARWHGPGLPPRP